MIIAPLPCPFCGGNPILESEEHGFRASVLIFCSKCGVSKNGEAYHITENSLVDENGESCDGGTPSAPPHRREKAIAAWNTRAPSPVNQELLEALRGVMKFEEIEEWATSTDEWLDEVLAKSIDERILQEAGAIKAARTAILNATK